MKSAFRTLTAAPALLQLVAGCSSQDPAPMAQGTIQAEASRAFPLDLAVASPFDYVPGTAAGPTSRYASTAAGLTTLVTGTDLSRCGFDPGLLLNQPHDAGCYGPVVAYQAHPDSQGPADPRFSGALPRGGVGVWVRTDPLTGQACAAAQLNARSQGVTSQSLAALSSVASFVCVAHASGAALPGPGPLPSQGALDLTTAMNGASVANLSFRRAALSYQADLTGHETYSYVLDYSFVSGGQSYATVVEMTHMPGEAAGQYRGRLSYRVSGVPAAGSCKSATTTTNGSVLYQRASATRLALSARGASFCGDGNGLTGGIVDPNRRYDQALDPTGWSKDFDIFTADFNPRTLAGSYAHAWQPAPADGQSRALNVTIRPPDGSGPLAQAFFGHGDDIARTDGSVKGFICNWAGPNASRMMIERAQSQSMAYDAQSGTFSTLDANLRYAPTNSCDYNGLGSFRYDSAAQGKLDTDPAVPIANELIPVTRIQVAPTGFVLPAAPGNF